MEDTTSLAVFAMFIACSAWLLYITYEPIKAWAWSDVKQNKKTHGSGSFRKKQVVISISRKVGK
ncbi:MULTISPECIES: hypothetical protein [Bacillus cereus group]|uniref:hypothetical protein n=1 Tax=Bacillus cereus group TaxID=86661 RepID=UPI000BF92D98|nr:MULTISPECIES: hypothetical protein [Bacillus cereus group]MBG9716630.1 phage protein [Bacillus cereus]MED2874028.1 hypothetical protein [Bacillus thuringiensis]PEZ32012.1 hypothetical protein CN346_19195 [Bacillus thuringiensis]PFV83975.1 hypothetical protein COL06_25540 [Bacillus thuringiensis]PGY57318.1 hypothetical protein COE24_19485 [Bacillus thuringiensis]